MSKDIMTKIADDMLERQYPKQDMINFGKEIADDCEVSVDVEMLFNVYYGEEAGNE